MSGSSSSSSFPSSRGCSRFFILSCAQQRRRRRRRLTPPPKRSETRHPNWACRTCSNRPRGRGRRRTNPPLCRSRKDFAFSLRRIGLFFLSLACSADAVMHKLALGRWFCFCRADIAWFARAMEQESKDDCRITSWLSFHESRSSPAASLFSRSFLLRTLITTEYLTSSGPDRAGPRTLHQMLGRSKSSPCDGTVHLGVGHFC